MIFKSKQILAAENARESIFDPVSGKYVAEIIGPFLDTQDEQTIEALKRLGYETVEEKIIEPQVEIKPSIMPPVPIIEEKPKKTRKQKE
jgi:hypothetical protein